jgi:hypothetical protein
MKLCQTLVRLYTAEVQTDLLAAELLQLLKTFLISNSSSNSKPQTILEARTRTDDATKKCELLV